MIKVNSVTISSPSTFTYSVMDLSQSERMANGNIKIEKKATKRKLELSWNYMSQSDLSTLLSAIGNGGATIDGVLSNVFFTVEYPDAVTGSLQTGYFYCGDRTAGAIDYQNNTMRYKDIKCNFIER